MSGYGRLWHNGAVADAPAEWRLSEVQRSDKAVLFPSALT